MIADAVYARDSQVSLARWYGEALATGLAVEDVADWPDRIEAVTGADDHRSRAQMAGQEAFRHRLFAARDGNRVS